MDIRYLRYMNSALPMKSLWNFYNSPDLPWVQLLMQKHYKHRPPSHGIVFLTIVAARFGRVFLVPLYPSSLQSLFPSVMVRWHPFGMLDGVEIALCGPNSPTCMLFRALNISRLATGFTDLRIVLTWVSILLNAFQSNRLSGRNFICWSRALRCPYRMTRLIGAGILTVCSQYGVLMIFLFSEEWVIAKFLICGI